MAEIDPLAGPRAYPEFILTPTNKAAKQAAADPLNAEYFVEQDGVPGLYISFADETRLEYTVGRSGADIYLPDPKGADISKVQCAFRLYPETGAVFLDDHSSRSNTETSASHSETTISLHHESRSVLVARGINTRIALGRDKYYQFEITWHCDGLYEFPPDGPLHTGPSRGQKRYVLGELIGGGSFGNVFRALDVFSGKIIAVKRFHSLEGKNQEFAKREINNLYRINRSTKIQHVHILEIIGVAGFHQNDNWGEIFMPLKQGSLKSLVNEFGPDEIPALADLVQNQMLHALKCIARHKIIHRDIKPENILFDTTGSSYHFELGDFGLSNNPDSAKTIAGTETFMAPEVWHRKKQTSKVDIWSLFATIVWVRNVDNFRTESSKFGAPDIHEWLIKISKQPEFAATKDMANRDPEKRPSAKELLKATAEAAGADEALSTGFGNMTIQQDDDEFEAENALEDMEQYDQYTNYYQYDAGESSNTGFGATPRAEEELGDYMSYSTGKYYGGHSGAGGTGYTGPGTEVPDKPTIKEKKKKRK